MERVPTEVIEPIPAALWRPLMWAYCEGRPMLFLIVSAVPGPLILRTWPATVTAALYFAAGWIAFRFLGAWEPHAYKVFRRARQYRNRTTATLFARASWRSPIHRFVVRRH